MPKRGGKLSGEEKPPPGVKHTTLHYIKRTKIE